MVAWHGSLARCSGRVLLALYLILSMTTGTIFCVQLSNMKLNMPSLTLLAAVWELIFSAVHGPLHAEGHRADECRKHCEIQASI